MKAVSAFNKDESSLLKGSQIVSPSASLQKPAFASVLEIKESSYKSDADFNNTYNLAIGLNHTHLQTLIPVTSERFCNRSADFKITKLTDLMNN